METTCTITENTLVKHMFVLGGLVNIKGSITMTMYLSKVFEGKHCNFHYTSAATSSDVNSLKCTQNMDVKGIGHHVQSNQVRKHNNVVEILTSPLLERLLAILSQRVAVKAWHCCTNYLVFIREVNYSPVNSRTSNSLITHLIYKYMAFMKNCPLILKMCFLSRSAE